MAKGILEHFLNEEGVSSIEVRTAGVMTIPGLMPTQECRQLLLKEGIDISAHRSCQLTSQLIERAALVLGMTSFHVQMALRLSEGARGKTHLLKEFTGCDPKNGQIQDPMGCTLEVYKKVYREIKAACKRLATMDLMDANVRAGRAPKVERKPTRKLVRKKDTETDNAKAGSKPAVKKEAAAKTPAQKKVLKKQAPAKKVSEKPAPKKPASKKENTKAEAPKKSPAKKAATKPAKE
jgi:protein-tyrosine phosphatase